MKGQNLSRQWLKLSGRFFLAVSLLALPLGALWAQDPPAVSVTNAAPTEFGIGSTGPAGGLIFHIDGDTHYEAAPADWDGNENADTALQWGCRGQATGGTGQTIGSGDANTAAIVALHDDSSNFGGEDYYTFGGGYGTIGCHSLNDGEVAAKLAADLELNGFGDWFLPSRGELDKIYANLHLKGLGGFAGIYWSSSETSPNAAWIMDVDAPLAGAGHKTIVASIRPVRAFSHANVPTVHQFNFALASGGSVGAFAFEYCTENLPAGEPCTPPHMDVTNFSVNDQSGAAGFTKNAAQTVFHRAVVTNAAPQSFSADESVSFTLGGIVNPDAAGEYYVRVTAYDSNNLATANVVATATLAFTAGWAATNVAPGLLVRDTVTGADIRSGQGATASTNPALRLETTTGVPLALFNADMSQDRDFAGVSAAVDNATYKSVVHGLVDVAGVSAPYALYVPKAPDHNQVSICPGAASLSDTHVECPGLFTRTAQDEDATLVTVEGTEYWLIEGLEGTGGFSTFSSDLLPGLPAAGLGIALVRILVALFGLAAAVGLKLYWERTRAA